VLFYTDGVIEAITADGEALGIGRLREFSSAQRNLDPATFVDRLVQTVSTGEPQDDVTTVLIEAI